MKEKHPYHHGNLPKALIESALLLLENKGIEGLSLRDVAKQAGVSHTAPYRHFSGKAHLLAELARQGFENLQQAIDTECHEGRKSNRQRLIAAGVTYVREAVSHPEMTRLMFSGQLDLEQNPAALKEAARKAFQSLEIIIASGIDDGSFRHSDPATLTITAWSTMHGLAMLYIAGHFNSPDGRPAELETLAVQVAESVLQGISITD